MNGTRKNSIASVQRQNKTIRSCLRLKVTATQSAASFMISIMCNLTFGGNISHETLGQLAYFTLNCVTLFLWGKLNDTQISLEQSPQPLESNERVWYFEMLILKCLKKWLIYHGSRESHTPFKEWWINEVASSHLKHYQHSTFFLLHSYIYKKILISLCLVLCYVVSVSYAAHMKCKNNL